MSCNVYARLRIFSTLRPMVAAHLHACSFRFCGFGIHNICRCLGLVLGATWITFEALGMYGGGLGDSLDTILGAGNIWGKSGGQSGCRLGISDVSRSKARENMTT